MKWIRYIGTIILFCGLMALFSQLKTDQNYLQEQATKSLIDQTLEVFNDPQRPLLSRSILIPIWDDSSVNQANSNYLNQKIKARNKSIKNPSQEIEIKLNLLLDHQLVTLKTTPEPAQGDLVLVTKSQPLSSWYSIVPPLIAVTVALLTQRLVLSLFMGILVGSIIYFDWNVFIGLKEVVTRYLYLTLTDDFKLKIFVFTGSLLGMVSVINTSGGTRGVIEALSRFMKNARSTKIVTAFMGLVIFFDDYANTMIIGSTLRPVTDKLKISREKLAYIVDSTAAPVSGIAIISTWIGYEVGLFQDILQTIQVDMGGYQAFFQALPFRFYCILSLCLVFLNVFMNKDFGPMYAAEKRAHEEGLVLREGAVPMTSRSFNKVDAKEGIPLRWYNAIIPILVVILGTIIGLYVSGGGWTAIQNDLSKVFDFAILRDSFSNADSATVLTLAALSGVAVSILLAVGQRILSIKESLVAFGQGLSSMLLAMVILTLAWAINKVCGDLGTANYLVSAFKDMVSPLWIPVLIFLLSGAIAFSTGSSWSTMAILIPAAIPLSYQLGGIPLMIISMGAVLDGSIFGDHCSPLSDTTIMTSISCSCDHLDHVKTQIPYALLAMVTGTFICYLPATMGITPYLTILGGVLFMGLFLLVFGKNPLEKKV